MDFTTSILGLALYILIWMKLPEWGTWFNTILSKLPQPLQTLYKQWQCPYCVGFWMGLALHAMTGLWTISAFSTLPEFWGVSAPFIGWFMDALVTATFILLGKLVLDAIGLPAMKGHMMKTEFLKNLK